MGCEKRAKFWQWFQRFHCFSVLTLAAAAGLAATQRPPTHGSAAAPGHPPFYARGRVGAACLLHSAAPCFARCRHSISCANLSLALEVSCGATRGRMN